MSIATESDLQDFIPDVYEHGLNSFSKELQFAESDVINLIKSDWWPSAVRSNYSYVQSYDVLNPLFVVPLDANYLNNNELKKLVVYRVAAAYIYPKLSTFKDVDGDSFSRKAEFYKGLYKDEWEIVKKLPLYDFNKDSVFSDAERKLNTGRRLSRA